MVVSMSWTWWASVGAVWAVWAGAGARELDPAACTPRFDIQRDKIIRTEESREMGARYISELDVGTTIECLRLCCETDACDVFVYEEKGPGSCYLFNCGPPEDFRCKFTSHSNFSSGVLALSRRLAELQDQEALVHHERDLATLRSAPTPAPATSTSSSTTTRRTTTSTPPPPPPAPLPPSRGRCSRYQFECRRGGECIAVYNACDGVPQCQDGSDEAPELGCPPSPGAAPPSPSPGAARARARAPDLWPHRLVQAQLQQRDRYNEAGGPPLGSHIFSHKGGLVQETEPAPPPPPPQYPPFEPPVPPWPRRVYPQQQNDMENVGGWSGSGGGGGYTWGEVGEGGRRAWPVVPQPRVDDVALYMAAKTMPEVPVLYSSQQHTLRDSAKKGLEAGAGAPPAPGPAPASPPSPDRREEVPPPPPPPGTTPRTILHDDKPKTKAAVAVPVAVVAAGAMERHLGHEHGHDDEAEAEAEADGVSERPPAPAAVLLLVLGVCMTACMAAMVGCRARAARRRLRRGKTLAHDADYLVNGMYL